MNSRTIDGNEVAWDGRTVWVNSGENGMSLARFSRVGIDVHKRWEEQTLSRTACLDCSHRDGASMTMADWRKFQSLMQEHHKVGVPDDAMPAYLKEAGS